jgi:predicted esterase
MNAGTADKQPSPSSRVPPLVFPATNPPPNPAHPATFIFLHGLGSDAQDLSPIPQQFQNANKLPYMSWVLPTALQNHDAMQTAWYTPSPLSPFPSQRPELDDPEDEAGMRESMAYIENLIDGEVGKGVPPNRIVLGGFSQGHAMSVLTSLISPKLAGKLAGIVGLSGYIPLAEQIPRLREEAGLPELVGGEDEVEFFVARGLKDMLVPKRHFRIGYETLYGTGVRKEKVEIREYEGMGHVLGGAELRDLSRWLERVVPPLE